MKTFSDIYNRKNNSYDDMRFILASMVLFVHSYALLYGHEKDFFSEMVNHQLALSTLAVYSFFILSGFFMIQSLEVNSFVKYVQHRVLRIIPAFWMSLLLFSFLIIPIVSQDIDIFSFHTGSSLEFVTKAGSFHIFGYAWTITGAFPDNPFIDVINGSMWTLKFEVALYFILPIIIWIIHDRKDFLLIVHIGLLLLAILNIAVGFNLFNIPCCKAWVFGVNEYSSLILFTSYFFAGVIFYKFKERIVVSKRIFILCILLFVLSMFFGNMKLVTLITLPYIVLIIGSVLKVKILSATGDYSYGMYIYSFPVQQILIKFFKNDINAIQLFFTSFFITLVLSVFSWHLLEKKFIKKKGLS